MLIGPFWCVESNAWLRFVVERERGAIAQMAMIDTNNPFLTRPWQLIEPGNWHAFDTQCNTHQHYRLDKKTLYRCSGINSITGLPVVDALYGEDKDSQPQWRPVPRRIQVFDDATPMQTPLKDGVNLPLTPEQQNEIWHEVQKKDPLILEVTSEFDINQRDELVEALKVALAGFKANQYPNFEAYLTALRDVVCNPQNRHHEVLLNQAARTVDYPSLANSPIKELPLKKMQFFLDLLAAAYNYIRRKFGLPSEWLTGDIESPEPTALHVGSQAVAQQQAKALPIKLRGGEFRREFIGRIHLHIFSPEQRLDLLVQLETGLTDFFNGHFNNLQAYCNNLNQVVNNDENEYHQFIQALPFSNDTQADRELCDLDINMLRDAKREFFFNVLREELAALTQQIGVSAAKSVTSGAPPNERHDNGLQAGNTPPAPQRINKRIGMPTVLEGKVGPQPLIVKLKTAVISAQKNYAEWYLDSNLYPHRGPNGFFSWARHGAYGQNRAGKLMESVKGIHDEQSVTSAINDYLRDDKTRYHRHSFASFLLDELKNIKGQSWFGFACVPSSNLYDKQKVIGCLNSLEVKKTAFNSC